ncbi:MAG TPA: M20/M25/M40 family metallo-hydrolase [Selenomonadales bacterium]|nr:M20/M25/M40 family metallo-hydrolase [Selenomonadales bacterium]
MNSIGEKILRLAVELTQVRSVVGTAGEVTVAEHIHAHLAKLPYFRNHPEDLRFQPIPGDPLGRKNVLALIRGRKSNPKRAVLCLGHIDTVGIQDFAELQPEATQPDQLKQKLAAAVKFCDETAAEIASDNWVLGRGIFDMKTGVAALMVMLELLSGQTEDLAGNLVFAGVPDEEGQSAGMLAAVAAVEALAVEEGWDFAAAVDTDYMTTRYPGDDHKYVYIGSVGKLLPCFYLYGEETHVGEAFNGLDANLLASEVLYQMDLSTDLCDVAEGEVTQPPVSLHQRDLKAEYSVQTANAVSIYFNYATHSSQPDEVLAKCKAKAAESFASVIKRLNEEYEKYCRLSHIPHQPLPWQVQVLTYEELYNNVKAEMGDEIDGIIEELAAGLKAQKVDDREFSLAVVHEVHKYYSDQNSKIIVYFAPPYYPHIYVKGEDAKEKRLLDVVNGAVEEAGERYDYKIVTRKFYPYISDLSYCRIAREDETIARLVNNMPAWSRTYALPVEAIRRIGMPVVNIGPFGKDAHKLSERVSKDYSFDAMPFILEKTLRGLLAGE